MKVYDQRVVLTLCCLNSCTFIAGKLLLLTFMLIAPISSPSSAAEPKVKDVTQSRIETPLSQRHRVEFKEKKEKTNCENCTNTADAVQTLTRSVNCPTTKRRYHHDSRSSVGTLWLGGLTIVVSTHRRFDYFRVKGRMFIWQVCTANMDLLSKSKCAWQLRQQGVKRQTEWLRQGLPRWFFSWVRSWLWRCPNEIQYLCINRSQTISHVLTEAPMRRERIQN